jgi:hypothetical protein
MVIFCPHEACDLADLPRVVDEFIGACQETSRD